MTRVILYAVCSASLLLTVVLWLQSMKVVRPLGVGWGDGTSGRAYSIEGRNGLIVVRTASGITRPPPGRYPYAVQTLSKWDGAVNGTIIYHRWNMTAGSAPQAPVLGRFVQLDVSGCWVFVLTLALGSVCVVDEVRRRRRARDPNLCRHCGYDLRATPDCCPECGRVPQT